MEDGGKTRRDRLLKRTGKLGRDQCGEGVGDGKDAKRSQPQIAAEEKAGTERRADILKHTGERQPAAETQERAPVMERKPDTGGYPDIRHRALRAADDDG